MKKYLLSKLRQVKEIFRKEAEQQLPDVIKDVDTLPLDGYVSVPLTPPPPGAPPELPDLPPLPNEEHHDVLRVSNNTTLPEVQGDARGRKYVKWTKSPMQKARKS